MKPAKVRLYAALGLLRLPIEGDVILGAYPDAKFHQEFMEALPEWLKNCPDYVPCDYVPISLDLQEAALKGLPIMNATEIMEAHKDAAWDALLDSIEVNQATATTARALFMAGWDAAMIRAAEAIREGRQIGENKPRPAIADESAPAPTVVSQFRYDSSDDSLDEVRKQGRTAIDMLLLNLRKMPTKERRLFIGRLLVSLEVA